MKICDLHTHVLPGVDDGAQTMEYACQMLRNAVASDVKRLVVTPHCNSGYGTGNYLDAQLQERFCQLQQAARDIPVELVLGAEVWADPQLPILLRQGDIPTINGGRYLLTEFSPYADADTFTELLQQICDLHYIPLVAHPERYMAVCEDPGIVFQWLEMGCHLQLTGGSILGEYGKKVQHTATVLLNQDVVACVASDAHGVNWRSNYLLDVYNHLAVYYSRQYACCMLYENPMRICDNDDL